MLVSPKWQTMWLESQYCSKSIMNVPLPSQQAKKALEDLRTNCSSPNKVVQLEALKCWGMWINSQNSDDWKLNTVCFTAVRPLITKKMQPLHKDVDICKLKLSLMWALLVKVENIMQLEGPQYILEVFLQSCLSWLSSTNGDRSEDEVSVLIYQLLLSILKQSETLNNFDNEMFSPLTTDIFNLKKVFHRLADKFLSIFLYWRKVEDKSMFLKLWKHFLEHCELSCEHIPIPLWHKVFKLADQICSERNEPVKDRLAFLHSCATTLKSSLASSKFIDFGNLMTTPCEALLKKLVELGTTKSTENSDSEMFVHSKEICQMLSDKSVAIGGFELCIRVLDVLEEFWLKELLWGVWCGLVHCYEVHVKHRERNHLTEVEMKFYRRLRGVAVNFELDRDALHKDCINEVEKHIGILNINCFCSSLSKSEVKDLVRSRREKEMAALEAMDVDAQTPQPPVGIAEPIVRVAAPRGNFSTVALYKRKQFVPKMTDNLKIDLIRHILKNIDLDSTKSLFNLLSFRFVQAQHINSIPFSFSLHIKADDREKVNLTLSCVKPRTPSPVFKCSPVKKNAVVLYDRHKKREIAEEEEEEEVISTPKTRSRKRAEEELKKEMENHKRKEAESQKRKKRRSFEVLVQEIVRKNKERKTEKNSRRKSPVLLKGKRHKKTEKPPANVIESDEKPEMSVRNLRHSKKEEPKSEKKKGEKSFKTDGKLENYFKVITKKSGSDVKKDETKPRKGKKKKKEGKKESPCCNQEREEGDKKGEIGWRQTSLKTMMNRKNKSEKNKRIKTTDDVEDKPKGKKGTKVTDSPLSKLSPFKEVFHDHEYAKIEPQQLETLERVVLVKPEMGLESGKKAEKPSREVVDEATAKRKPESLLSHLNLRELKKDDVTAETRRLQQESTEPIHDEKMETCSETDPDPLQIENTPKADPQELEKILDIPNLTNMEEGSEVPIPGKRGRKRVRMLDSLKPSKKVKLDEDPPEEKLPLEITEKENLDEKQPKMSPTKKEKTGMTPSGVKCEESPKTGNGMISSRALRMIALVPESTKGSQIQWESTPRAEILKCKKAPNVDKNSRASKMLALLSENVTESEEVDEVSVEELSSKKGLMSTPNLKTPVSSLKSPKSIKKRRSIRFDDAKNETVLYQTDTPPSQILEEKEKCRRIKPADV